MPNRFNLLNEPAPPFLQRFPLPEGTSLLPLVIVSLCCKKYLTVAVTRQLSGQLAIFTLLILLITIPADVFAIDLGAPKLSAPLQYGKFFETTRLSAQPGEATTPSLLEPQLSVSHHSRESDSEGGTTRITHKIHGEAGGRLNLLENLSLTAVARIPLYTYQMSSGQTSASEGRGSPDLMHSPTSRISWRSELGLNLGKGIDLNLFYDKSRFGRMDRPGLNDQDERFGTRFIIHFK